MFHWKLKGEIKVEIDNLVKYISDMSLVTAKSSEEIGHEIKIFAKDFKEKLKSLKKEIL